VSRQNVHNTSAVDMSNLRAT